MKIHELKTVPEPFEAIWVGRKMFELRRDDRGFNVGDQLRLVEWTPDGGAQRIVCCEVSYIVRYGDFPGLEPGYVVMGICNLQRLSVGDDELRGGQ